MDKVDLDTVKFLTQKRSELLSQKKKIEEQLKAYELVLTDLSSINPRRDLNYSASSSSISYSANTKARNGNGKEQSVSDIVADYVDGLNTAFTRRQIKQFLTANHPDRKFHENYLYILLNRLEEKEIIKVVKKGSGRKGNLYKRNFDGMQG